MRHSADPKAALPLTPAMFAILLSLADGEKHGYAIAREAALSSGGTVKLGPATLYRLIKEMAEDGWIVETQNSGDQRRRCYRLTPRGKQVTRLEAERLDGLVRQARTLRLLSQDG